LKRIEELHRSGTVSDESLDQARTNQLRQQAQLRSSRSAVELARYELEAAQTTLRYSAAEDGGRTGETVSVVSPVSGRVLKLIRESEGVAGAAEPLLEVGNPRGLEVEVEVLSSDAVKIGPGARVLFERWGGEKPLEGVVRRVEPVGFTKISALGVEEQRVLVIADIISPEQEWSRLGDQYRVEAVFILWEGEDVLQVSTSALFRYEDGWAGFVIEGATARRRLVEIAHQSGLQAEVVSGLSEADMVIAHPADSIEDGTEVELRPE
jgi:HlyD family secretion protein